MSQPNLDHPSPSRGLRTAPYRTRLAALGALLALTAVGATGCAGADTGSRQEGRASGTTFESCGRTVELDRAPKRVAITTDAIADTLFALGVGDRIVAKTRGESAPAPELKERLAALPGLGTRNPNTEALIAARPDLLITDQVEKVSGKGGSPSVAELKRLGVATYVVGGGCAADLSADTSGLEALDADLRQLGAIFGVETRARALAGTLRGSLDEVRRRIAREPGREVAEISQVAGQLYVTTGGLADDVLERAGGKNVFADLPGQFAPVSAEQIVARNPQAIIVDDFTATTKGRKDAIAFLKRTFPTVDAVKKGRFLVIDAAKTGARGSTRPVEGVTEIARFLHPSTSGTR
ncbi:ABC transporter substrate-binding protein [Streptomyces cyaneofuscatus]|uniref:ABC transporter substrate-binding protein n=1 Tax=Streptomyces cyaneofuscatus TaxID=66883 RepID=UPI0029545C08|nr:ABC transporter substrate-binding protein [Streptomyces cyaneofuscatus]WOP13068.1 ABC transporter substrate-binding protein [Streptomyces cyaneofuscatus]